MTSLWIASSRREWREALERYEDVIARQRVVRLPDLDRWYREALPEAILARRAAHVTLPELVRLTEWKMARGVWRAPNLVLVRGNDPDEVVRSSTEALASMPHPTAPIKTLATLAGIGPATASAVAAAAAPDLYPFFDELVAGQIPQMGPVAWTLGYYARYAVALRERAAQLGDDWSPVTVERALWSHAGGKTGNRS